MQSMNAKDAVSASLAECFVTIEGNRYNFMQAINLEASIEKTKSEIPILGRTGKGNKTTGWKGSGSATFHYNTSIFREQLYRYKETGQDVYFDIQITNEDPTSSVGRQTIILKDCNVDGGILAKFDADAEYLDEDLDFTFEDWEMPEQFSHLQECSKKERIREYGRFKLFLAQNAVKAENVKHVVSRRFLDKAGRPMEWEIQSITSTEDEALRRECTKKGAGSW